MVTKSTDEAMDLLERFKKRRIEWGRYIGAVLASRHGKTNGRLVRDEMERRGLLLSGGNEHWLGAIFRKRSLFRPTDQGYVIPDGQPPEDRNIHDWRPVKEWELQPGAKIPPQPLPWTEEMPDFSLEHTEYIDDCRVEVLMFSEGQPYWQQIDFASLKKGYVFRFADENDVMGKGVKFCTGQLLVLNEDGEEMMNIADVTEPRQKRIRSSAGKSSRFLTCRSPVRIRPGPPHEQGEDDVQAYAGFGL
jgi:hypothetical protein